MKKDRRNTDTITCKLGLVLTKAIIERLEVARKKRRK